MSLALVVLCSCSAYWGSQEGFAAAKAVLASAHVSSQFKAIGVLWEFGESTSFPWIAQEYAGPSRLIAPDVVRPPVGFIVGKGPIGSPGSPFLSGKSRTLAIWHGPNTANPSLPCAIVVYDPGIESSDGTGKIAVSVMCPAPGVTWPPVAAGS
jgi:hypothetical protein